MASGNMVYVVDDEACVRKALARFFRAAGFAVEIFATARSFLDYEKLDRSACLLLDVCMPGLSGPELLEELELSHLGIPIVLMTGYSDFTIGDLTAGRGESVSIDVLAKPFDEHEILGAVRRALAGPTPVTSGAEIRASRVG